MLEETRQIMDKENRKTKYSDIQELIVNDSPAVFLYSPFYLYMQSTKIMGFKTSIISVPSDRFNDIGKWYIETKRRRP
jgi:peptide/nickel transport system substrate-binding protein